MLIRLSTQHGNRQTYMIHVLKHCNTDENDNNDIFITNWIFLQMTRKEMVKQMIHQEYVFLKPIKMEKILLLLSLYTVLIEIAKEKTKEKAEDLYTYILSMYIERKTISTIIMNNNMNESFHDDEKVYSSGFVVQLKDKIYLLLLIHKLPRIVYLCIFCIFLFVCLKNLMLCYVFCYHTFLISYHTQHKA